MRRTPGPLLTTALALGLTGVLGVAGLVGLAGCGAGSGPSSHVPETSPAGPSGSSGSSGRADGSVDFTEVALLSQTAAGGRSDERATVLADRAAVDAFAGQFRTEAMGHRLARAVARADVPAGRALAAAVVSIGCDVPPGVDVYGVGDGLRIVAQEVADPHRECFAPVTTVAVVLVDADLV